MQQSLCADGKVHNKQKYFGSARPREALKLLACHGQGDGAHGTRKQREVRIDIKLNAENQNGSPPSPQACMLHNKGYKTPSSLSSVPPTTVTIIKHHHHKPSSKLFLNKSPKDIHNIMITGGTIPIIILFRINTGRSTRIRMDD